MELSWKNYIEKRLGQLIDEADNPQSRKKAFLFINRHMRTLPKAKAENLVIPDLTQAQHFEKEDSDDSSVEEGLKQNPDELVKYAPRIVSRIPTARLLNWASSDQNALDAFLGKSWLVRKLVNHIKSSTAEILDQRQCRVFVDNEKLWKKLNPDKRWWAIFKWLPFVANIISRRKDALAQKSPLFKAKLENKTLYKVADDDMSYFNGFLREENNTVLFEELTKNISQDQLLEINDSNQWDDRVKQYIRENFKFHMPKDADDLREEESKPAEEAERRRVEEELKGQEQLQKQEALKQEELKRQKELKKQEVLKQEELKRQEELQKQEALKQEELKRQEELQKQEALKQEELKRQEELQKQEALKQQEEAEKHAEVEGKKEVEELPDQNQFFDYENHPPKAEYDWDKEKDYLATHAKNTSYDRNNDPHAQFKQDILMTEAMLANPGGDEYLGQLSARMIKKLMYVMAHADPMYKREGQWYRFSKPHEADKQIPVASILSHTTRITIELPTVDDAGTDLGREFFRDFLWENNPHKREAATHGVVVRPKPEVTCDGIQKNVDEVKPGLIEAAMKAVHGKVNEYMGYELPEEGHYGVNCALGGAGNKHFLSGRIINDEGENGHIYMYYLPATSDKPGAIVIGIEQSAPSDCASPDVVYFPHSVYDNLGGGHTPFATPNHFSATGGDHFGKPPKYHKDNKDYEGIQDFGPDKYYNSMYLPLNRDQLTWIIANYRNDTFEQVRIDRPPVGTISELGDFKAEQEEIQISEQTTSMWGRFFGVEKPKLERVNTDEIIDQFEMVHPGDETSVLHVINQAKSALQKYLDKQGIEQYDKEKMEYFIRELTELRNAAHLAEIINEMEAVNVHMDGDEFVSIRNIVIQQHGECLSEEIRKGLKMDVVEEEDQRIHGTVLGGNIFKEFMSMIYTASDVHFKDQLIEAHQYLIKLLPEHIQVGSLKY